MLSTAKNASSTTPSTARTSHPVEPTVSAAPPAQTTTYSKEPSNTDTGNTPNADLATMLRTLLEKVNDLTRAKIGTDNHGPESTQGQEEEIANLRSARRIPLRRRHHHIRRNSQTPSVRRKHPPSSTIYDNRQAKHLQRNLQKLLDQLNEIGTVNLPPMHQDPTTRRSLHDQRKPKHFQSVLRDITENEGTKEETRRRRQKIKRKTPMAKENIREEYQDQARHNQKRSEAEARLARVSDRISRIDLCSCTYLGPTSQGISRAESRPPPKEETLSVKSLKNPDPTAKPRPDSHGSGISRAESRPPPKEETLSVKCLKDPDTTAKPRPDSHGEAEARLARVGDRISRIELCSCTCLGPTVQGINRAESCPLPKEETLSLNGLKNPDPTAKPRPDSHGSAIG
ncbi:hypothetical protein F2Q69_00011965 [Brassica cretica]|uniref:Uncharacterized protein n=1 Tax=Brassica cretica TaxID=69181 RepID=A0A8S9R7Q6_BRACR|nr:hypothetical protein F2Q69_00011965 [Brassica cretica]